MLRIPTITRGVVHRRTGAVRPLLALPEVLPRRRTMVGTPPGVRRLPVALRASIGRRTTRDTAHHRLPPPRIVGTGAAPLPPRRTKGTEEALPRRGVRE